MKNWINQWKVKSSTSNNVYTVSEDGNHNYACSCPAWTHHMPRKDCRHINEVKDMRSSQALLGNKPIKKAKYVLAQVNKPTYVKKNNTLLVPLLRLPDTILMEASIAYMMLKHGWTWQEVQEQRRLPKSWNATAVINHVKLEGGIVSYPPDKRRK
jgi:hypothetical protein